MRYLTSPFHVCMQPRISGYGLWVAGAYTACRTVGGFKSESILKLEYHLDRLSTSLRLLFPTHKFDDLNIDSPGAQPDLGTSSCLMDAPRREELLILYGGEARGGHCASEQIAKQLQERVPGARLGSMALDTPGVLRTAKMCAIIREWQKALNPIPSILDSFRPTRTASLA